MSIGPGSPVKTLGVMPASVAISSGWPRRARMVRTSASVSFASSDRACAMCRRSGTSTPGDDLMEAMPTTLRGVSDDHRLSGQRVPLSFPILQELIDGRAKTPPLRLECLRGMQPDSRDAVVATWGATRRFAPIGMPSTSAQVLDQLEPVALPVCQQRQHAVLQGA